MRILHVSDLHFGRKQHAFTSGGETDPRALADTLTKPGALRPDVVVISGDLGWSGEASDYVDALRFCTQLRQRFSSKIIITPGNHDVNREDGIDDDRRQDAFVDFAKQLYKNDFRSTYPLLGKTSTGLSSRQRIVSFHQDVEREFVIVTVNSAARIHGWQVCKNCRRRHAFPGASPCSKCNLPHPCPTGPAIAVESRVATEIEDLLKGTSSRSLRLLVLHHNLFPFADPDNGDYVELTSSTASPDTTMLANSVALQSWLGRNGFHAVLHGHRHEPQGRQDTLFRRDDTPQGRQIVVLGAGSTGVYRPERGTAPLSYFALNFDRLSNNRFQVRAEPMKIETGSLAPYTTPDFAAFTCEVGPHPPVLPPIFYAEKMSDCHDAIFQRAANSGGPEKPGPVFRNFMSIVDVVEFVLPRNTYLDGNRVTEKATILASFYGLHPEYEEGRGWGVQANVSDRLRKVRPRFRFSHGSRIFGLDPQVGDSEDGGGSRRSPIANALSALKAQWDTSHAFVGVFNSHVDAHPWQKPPPALSGIQFTIPEPGHLDVTFSFRKLDLSFWWVVNMLEAIELWKWAVEDIQRDRPCDRGRITFFATLAQWKGSGSSATFKIDLDEMEIEELITVVLMADSGKPDRLLQLVREKRERTNEDNIDAGGVAALTQVVRAVCKVHGSGRSALKREAFCANLEAAGRNLGLAEKAARNRLPDRHEVNALLADAKVALQQVEAALGSGA